MHWYYGGWPKWRVRGYHQFHNVLGIAYLLLCIIPLWHYFRVSETHNARETVQWLFNPPLKGLGWLICTTVGLPLYVWWENLGFDNWLTNHCAASDEEKESMKDRFALNSKYMEGTWKAVAGLYLAGGLLSFSSLGSPPEDTKNKELQEVIQTLTHATKSLDAAVKQIQSQPVSPEFKSSSPTALQAMPKP